MHSEGIAKETRTHRALNESKTTMQPSARRGSSKLHASREHSTLRVNRRKDEGLNSMTYAPTLAKDKEKVN